MREILTILILYSSKTKRRKKGRSIERGDIIEKLIDMYISIDIIFHFYSVEVGAGKVNIIFPMLSFDCIKSCAF